MEPIPNWRAELHASLRAPQEPQACPLYSVLGAKASEVEVGLAPLQEPHTAPHTPVVAAQDSEMDVGLAPNWKAHLAASLQALQKPKAAPRASDPAPTRLCESAFVSDSLAASCAASPLLPAKRQPFHSKSHTPKP